MSPGCCKSLHYGISDGLMTRLQSVENDVAGLVYCRALDGLTTSRRCYTSCTGFWFGSRCNIQHTQLHFTDNFIAFFYKGELFIKDMGIKGTTGHTLKLEKGDV